MLNNYSLVTEIKQHIIESIEETDFDLTETVQDAELHYYAFNQGEYIIGYHQASEWLKKHDIDPFEAISYVIDAEEWRFGEMTIKANEFNSERIVNLLVYYVGEDILNEIGYDETLEDVLTKLKDEVA